MSKKFQPLGGLRRTRAPFRWLRTQLARELLQVAAAMADGSYYAPSPNDRDFEPPQPPAAGF